MICYNYCIAPEATARIALAIAISEKKYCTLFYCALCNSISGHTVNNNNSIDILEVVMIIEK